MPAVRMMKNTDKTYRCVHCGSDNTSIIKEDESNPRLKCNGCDGTFDGRHSIQAEAAGAIPDKPPTLQDPNPEPTSTDSVSLEDETINKGFEPEVKAEIKRIPRKPAYVLIQKDRKDVEYVTEKDLEKALLKWSAREKKFELYELTPKEATVKVQFE